MSANRNNGRRLAAGAIRITVVVAAAVIVGGIIHFYHRTPANGHGGRGRFSSSGPQPVSAAPVKIADVPVWISALGTATPWNLVTVRTRIDGELTKVYFREGQTVKPGQALAEIDPRPYQVQLTQAMGQLAKDSALLKNAQADLARYRDLWSKNSIARQQLDTQQALVRQYQGTVESDRGLVASAKLQLTYCHITAPIGGRVGLRQVDPGNIVHAADANGLVVIAQTRPMAVLFSVPESDLPQIEKRLADKAPITVEAWDQGMSKRIATGRLLTLDNLVDTSTETVKLKAEFANRNEALFPNQFVNARLLLTVRKHATVVPSAAVFHSANGTIVYRIGKDDRVTSVPVKPGPVNGTQELVEGALKAGDKVVTDGVDKLRDGARVEVIVPGTKNTSGTGQRRRRGGKGASGAAAT